MTPGEALLAARVLRLKRHVLIAKTERDFDGIFVNRADEAIE
jgi:hypothetical protein